MEKRIAVITGATSGIGAAYARRFAQEGYDLILTGRRKEIIESEAAEIRKVYGAEVEVITADLAYESETERLIERIQGKQVEILVNNAGFGVNRLYQDSDLIIMEQMAGLGVLTPMKLIHSVLPGMKERGRGTIINISSGSVFLLIPGNALYSGIKAFLKTFTEGLRLDLADTGVKVLAVCPGLVRTDFHEKMGISKERQKNRGLMHWMEPEEVVKLSLHALEKDKTVCIPGVYTKLLIGLLSMMPRKTYYKFASGFGGKNSGKHQPVLKAASR